MEVPENLRYARTHTWVRLEGDNLAVIGLTDHAQRELGNIVYLELPEVGFRITSPQQPFGVIESDKAAADLYSPVCGEVVQVHTELRDEVENINEDPYGEGWMIVVCLENPQEVAKLLTAEEYRAFIAAEG
ncbi:MAG TPA: glycine cleavage system protein GcvH [Armatimonadetes bacterium]|nr:glycine cleavage system protein GcvH [Armatimonadota bacterium]